VAYPDGGYYVMRGGWGAADPVAVVDCGVLGYGPAGHGHADALSIQLHAEGYPFLVDSGTYSYNIDYTWRDVFRGTRAHNTVVVDGQDQSVPRDRMSWATMARSTNHEWISTHWFDLIHGEHDGYSRLTDPVTHDRVVIFLKPDLWVIWDRLVARARHRFELMFHMMPDCRVVIDPSRSHAVLTSPGSRTLKLWLSTDAGDPDGFDVITGGEDQLEAWYSPGYGARIPSRAIKVGRDCEGGTAFITCGSTRAIECRAHSPQKGAIVLGVRHGDGLERCVFYLGHGADPLSFDGVHFEGATLLCCERTTGPLVWANRFRRLSVKGLVELEAFSLVDKLILAGNRCEVTLNPTEASGLRCSVREGIDVIVNGNTRTNESARVRRNRP
jgi:hypothetical protein